jgi:hypothetical protein
MSFENGPLSPPPAASSADGERLEGSSYQNSRPAAIPIIHQYNQKNNQGAQNFFRLGDANLEPNVGLTNSYDTAVFGLALHEILENLRLANMIAAGVSIILLLVTWLFRLVKGELDRVVLSSYLGFLSLVLLMLELMSIYKIESVDSLVKENFGFLQHPVGKSVFLYLLATLCWAIGGVLEFIVSILYVSSATILLFVWVNDPEFRRAMDEHRDADNVQTPARSAQTWTEYASSFTNYAKATSETASLLGSVQN